MSVINAGIFAAGLACGAGIIALTRSSSQDRHIQIAAEPNEKLPVVSIGSPSPNEVLKYGFPGPVTDISHRQAYVAAYDRRLRCTAQWLTASNLQREPTLPDAAPADRSNSHFKEDAAVLPAFRAKLEDYFRSGYDRGHLVPAADAKRNQSAMDETFYLTNIAPQVGEGFNRNYWAYLEDFCRRLTSQFANVFVFTVPLYLPMRDPLDGKFKVSYEVIGPKDGPPSVSVPTHFAKVILAADSGMPGQPGVKTSLGAFVLPNAPIPDEKPLTDFVVPVEAVERAAGLTLFSTGLKLASRPLCQDTICAVLIRKFDDANRKQRQRSISAPAERKLIEGPKR